MERNMDDEARLDAYLDGGFSEPVSISWEYWIGQVPRTTAKEASRLMAGLEPHAFEDLATCDQTKGDIAGRVARARKIELLAIREGVTEATPREWLAWAKQRNLNLHAMFAVAVDEWQPMQPERYTPAQSITGPCCVTKAELIDGLGLVGSTWDERLKRPQREGKQYLPALEQRGKRGDKVGGLWNPVVFARLTVENRHLNRGQVIARFKKAWPQWEAELEAEMGEI